MEQICLRDARKKVDDKYVGFPPNGNTVKPVHIANGAFRAIHDEYNRTESIKRMALVADAKGNTPKGNDTPTIYKWLLDQGKIDDDNISENALESMRNVMQRLLNVDKGVYIVKGLKDSMVSYSAGSKYFLTDGSGFLLEDAGEFMGGLITAHCPQLADYIKEIMAKGDDPITTLFIPVREYDMESCAGRGRHVDLPAFPRTDAIDDFMQGIADGGNCLCDNFRKHPNPLTQLRLFNLFCIFNLIRYITMLEAFYCGESVRPILLDFSGKQPNASSVARMSEMSYTQLYKSINRFYAWGYADWLKRENGYTKNDLLNSETPVYAKTQGKKVNKASKEELDALWALAKERAADLDDDDMYLAFGETMYDMLALETSSHPVSYIRSLGTAAGILYPPDRQHPNKRFAVSQDVLEMLLRSCLKTGEVIRGAEIRERLWKRFGIIVGGSQYEMGVLQSNRMILQADEDALEENFASFAAALESMDFAEVMADGILQIRMGRTEL